MDTDVLPSDLPTDFSQFSLDTLQVSMTPSPAFVIRRVLCSVQSFSLVNVDFLDIHAHISHPLFIFPSSWPKSTPQTFTLHQLTLFSRRLKEEEPILKEYVPPIN